jgi:ribosomal 50S subunit-recycling heat shock protein
LRSSASYNVSEKQMRSYYAKASHSHESTGTVLLSYLETRADAAIYRMGFARTIYAARQYIAHGHFNINGNRIFTPSHLLKVGDVISVQEKSKNHPQLIEALTHSGGIQVPEYYDGRQADRQAYSRADPREAHRAARGGILLPVTAALPCGLRAAMERRPARDAFFVSTPGYSFRLTPFASIRPLCVAEGAGQDCG